MSKGDGKVRAWALGPGLDNSQKPKASRLTLQIWGYGVLGAIFKVGWQCSSVLHAGPRPGTQA